MTDFRDWMGKLSISPNEPITNLSIPGTHDSCAIGEVITTDGTFTGIDPIEAPFEILLAKTQNDSLTITKQLNAGIRFLDLRVGSWGGNTVNEVYLCHGKYRVQAPNGIKLITVLQEIYDFLDANPLEFIFMRMQRDGPAPADKIMAVLLYELMDRNPGRWYLGTWANGPPKYSEVTGQMKNKIVLLRSFGILNLAPRGLDMTFAVPDTGEPYTHPYPDLNPKFNICISGRNTSQKPSAADCLAEVWTVCEKGLDSARTSKAKEDLFFSTGCGTVTETGAAGKFGEVLGRPYLLTPQVYAEGIDHRIFGIRVKQIPGINQRIVQKAMTKQEPGKSQRLGIVMVDFASTPDELIQSIIQAGNTRS